MTDDEIRKLWIDIVNRVEAREDRVVFFAREIIAAHDIEVGTDQPAAGTEHLPWPNKRIEQK